MPGNKRTIACRRAGWAVLALFIAALASHPAIAQDLKFGFTPVLGRAQIKAEFDPLMAYLSDALGRKVVIYVAGDYGDLRTQMELGAVDIGSFSPFAYVDAARGGKIRIIAQSLIDGSASYRGLIIVRKDSGLNALSDLAGKRFAYVDPKSASGYVYPRAMLIERGISPDAFFGEVIFAGDHRKVIADVLGGRVDAGAIYDTALLVARNEGVPTGELGILARTDPIPHDAIAVRVGLDEVLAQKIQAALVSFENTTAGRRIIANSKKGLTGFQLAADSVYDPVRRTAGAAAMAGDPAFSGRWRLDAEQSSALDGWSAMDLVIQTDGSRVSLRHDMTWRTTKVTATDVIDTEHPVAIPDFFRVDQRHMAVYARPKAAAQVRAAWLDGGRTLRVEAEVPLEVSQGDRTMRLYDEYRLLEGDRELVLIELHSTRNRPLVYHFTKVP